MNDIKIASAFLSACGTILLGVFFFLLLTQMGAPQDFLTFGGYGLVGVFMVLSGVGLWRLKRWGVYFYFLFFIIRSTLRFPDLLTGDWYEIVRYVFWAVIWFLLGVYLWRRVNKT